MVAKKRIQRNKGSHFPNEKDTAYRQKNAECPESLLEDQGRSTYTNSTFQFDLLSMNLQSFIEESEISSFSQHSNSDLLLEAALWGLVQLGGELQEEQCGEKMQCLSSEGYTHPFNNHSNVDYMQNHCYLQYYMIETDTVTTLLSRNTLKEDSKWPHKSSVKSILKWSANCMRRSPVEKKKNRVRFSSEDLVHELS